MRAETVLEPLRHGHRWGAPVGVRASAMLRLACGAALLAMIAALLTSEARAAEVPTPDPYPSQKTSVPAPDPAPSANQGSTTKAVEQRPTAPDPAPPSAAQSSSSGAVRPREAAPAQASASPTRGSNRRAVPTTHSGPVGRAAPSQVGANAAAALRDAPEAALPATSDDGRALLLAGLALFALVLASSSLLHLLTRVHGPRWEA